MLLDRFRVGFLSLLARWMCAGAWMGQRNTDGFEARKPVMLEPEDGGTRSWANPRLDGTEHRNRNSRTWLALRLYEHGRDGCLLLARRRNPGGLGVGKRTGGMLLLT